ncbi:choline transporter-like family protein [Skeletonema marinoi]|uniref:Choline transporter-like protein n=1 Tax=Skeletonema marinoi TaxID=267567 RepID=A0AAD8YCY1_9STRA|nr:choline transporter-like family protein [Skeletonema marinoi]
MSSKDADLGEKLSAPPDFNGPTSKRHMTDILCTVLLWCMWIAMTGLGLYAMQQGDYRLILYPLDYDGNLCGTNKGQVDMTDYPYLYYVNDFSGGVCVSECPKLENLTDVKTLVTYSGLYQVDGSYITSDDIAIADYSYNNDTLACTETLCYPNGDPEESFTSYGVNMGKGFSYYAMDTYELMWRCVFTDEARDAVDAIVNPNDQNNLTSVIDTMATQNEQIKQGYSIWNNLYGDLWVARYYILGLGFGAPLVVGFVYSLFLRIPLVLPFMVWFSVAATIAIVFGGAYYAGELAAEWENADPPMYTDDNIKVAQYGSYALYAFGGLLVIVFLFMRKRIQLAMGCVKEASKAILRLPLIIVFPVIQALGFAAFMTIWTVYCAYLASMGEFKTQQIDTVPGLFISVRYFEFSDFIKQCGWFMLFCFFWSGQFIIAIGEIIFAMSISKWYFARDKKKVGSGAVISSIWTSIWYHTGTAAFGSLIIAIFQMIRAVIAYLQKKADEMDSSLAKAILCCLQCVVLCFEKIFKFINKNAYIQTAIFGSSFCKSAKEAYCLIMRNAARIIAITYVSGGVVFVGKMFITTLTTGAAYFVLDNELRDELYSNIGPLFFIALSAWFISGMFMGVFDMGIATILQCFVADEEMYGDSQSMYAEGSLKNWVNDHGKSSEKRGCMD